MDLIEVSDNPNRHPWELSRTRSILRVLKKYQLHGDILDIGCGDSYFDRKLSACFPETRVYGVDIFLKEEFHEGNVHAVNSPEHLPDCKFDCIIMMDVLEHIEKDTEYICDMLKYLKPDGLVFITVPAFMKLYSLHDRELKHYRRYDHKMLGKVIRSSKLMEREWSYFYFSLILGRLLTMNRTENLSGWRYAEKNLITRTVKTILNLDFDVLTLLAKVGIHLPGLSLMSVCSLKNGTENNAHTY